MTHVMLSPPMPCVLRGSSAQALVEDRLGDARGPLAREQAAAHEVDRLLVREAVPDLPSQRERETRARERRVGA